MAEGGGATACLTLRAVLDEIGRVTEWYQLGIELEVDTATLKTIEANHKGDLYRCKTEVVDWWLLNATHPSWATLAKAVEKLGGHANLVTTLRRKAGMEQCSNGISSPGHSPSASEEEDLELDSAVSAQDGGVYDLVSGVGGVYDMTSGMLGLVSESGTDKLKESDLEVETYKIEGKFNVFFTCVHRALGKKNVKFGDFLKFLGRIKAFEAVTTSKNKPLLAAQLTRLRKMKSVGDVFQSLADYCSWFNHLLLDDIIETYCEEDESVMRAQEKFNHRFRDYCKHRVWRCRRQNGFGFGRRKDKEKIVVKVDKRWNCVRVKQIVFLRDSIAEILDLHKHTLYLCTVEKGCVQLTFLVPAFVAEAIFPPTVQQELALSRVGIFQLTCGDYHFPMLGTIIWKVLLDGNQASLFYPRNEVHFWTAKNLWIFAFFPPLKVIFPFDSTSSKVEHMMPRGPIRPGELRPREPGPIEPRGPTSRLREPGPIEPRGPTSRLREPGPIEPRGPTSKLREPGPIEPRGPTSKLREPGPIEPRGPTSRLREPGPIEPRGPTSKLREPGPIEPRGPTSKLREPGPIEPRGPTSKLREPGPIEPRGPTSKLREPGPIEPRGPTSRLREPGPIEPRGPTSRLREPGPIEPRGPTSKLREPGPIEPRGPTSKLREPEPIEPRGPTSKLREPGPIEPRGPTSKLREPGPRKPRGPTSKLREPGPRKPRGPTSKLREPGPIEPRGPTSKLREPGPRKPRGPSSKLREPGPRKPIEPKDPRRLKEPEGPRELKLRGPKDPRKPKEPEGPRELKLRGPKDPRQPKEPERPREPELRGPKGPRQQELREPRQSRRVRSELRRPREPREPMELCICIGEQWKFRKVVDRLSTHIVQCLSSHYDCGDKICGYFRWFYPGHYNQCDKKFQEGDPCISCLKLLQWVAAHAKTCHYESNCGLQLCHEVKRQWLRKSVKCYWAPQEVEQPLAMGMGYQNPEESLTNLPRRSSDPPTGSSEPFVTSDQYQTRESSIDQSSDHHRSLLEKQESFVLPHDVSHFDRLVSQSSSLKRGQNRLSVSSVYSRTSIESVSSRSSFSDVNRADSAGYSRESINGQSVDESDVCPCASNPTAPIQRADSAGGYLRMVIFDNSLDMTSHSGHIAPHPHTYHNPNQSQPFARRTLTSNQSFDKSSELFEGLERRNDSGHGPPTTGTQSPSSLSSYEGSDMECGEEEEVSYQTDDNSTLTGGSTLESTSASTPSKQISLATGLESGQMGTRQHSQLTERSVKSAMANIDATLAANRTDVRMKHFGKPLKQQPALEPPKSDEELEAPYPGLPKGFSLDYDLDHISDKVLRSSKQFAKKEQPTECSDMDVCDEQTDDNCILTGGATLDSTSLQLKVVSDSHEATCKYPLLKENSASGHSRMGLKRPQSPSSLSDYESVSTDTQEKVEICLGVDDSGVYSGDHTLPTLSTAQVPSASAAKSISLVMSTFDVTPAQIHSAMANIDAAIASKKDIGDHLGKVMKQMPSMEPQKAVQYIDLDLDYVEEVSMAMDGDCEDLTTGDRQPRAMQVHEEERHLYQQMFPESYDDIEKQLEQWDSTREYLQGQFYHQQAYREGKHWKKRFRLGSAGQATCFIIMDKETNSLLALKEEAVSDRILSEDHVCVNLTRLMTYQHPNIVEYFGVAIVPRPSGEVNQLFMELMFCDLQGFLFKCGPLNLEDTHNFACQLFEAVDFIHNRLMIIHCDIKPSNLLMDFSQQRLKLADFGCAELLEETDHPTWSSGIEKAGTLAYNPPEFYREKHCSFAFDIWQAGCSVLAMCTGRRPWRHLFMDCVDRRGKRDPQVIRIKQQYKEMIAKQLSGHMIPAFVDEGLQQLLFGCLHPHFSRRLSAQDCTYLLASAEAGTEEQKRKVVEAFGHSQTIDVLHDFSPNPHRLDVYLGYTHDATIAGLRHKLQGGWIGSVPYHDGMVYEELYGLLTFPDFPITQLIPSYTLAMCDNFPQGIWRTVSNHPGGVQFLNVSESMRVDRTKAVVILPHTRRR